MDLNLIKPAEHEPVLLSEVRDFLKIETDQEDALLLGLISAARRACETYIGRFLIFQDWQITLNDFDSSGTDLPLSPVSDIVKIEIEGETEFEEVPNDVYRLDKTSYLPRITLEKGKNWPEVQADHSGIKITFTVGFGANWNAVPADLKLGILQWISAVYEHREGGKIEIFRQAEMLWSTYRMVKL